MKKTLVAMLCMLQLGLIFAASAKYESDNYNLNLIYNEVITPGDAIFVRMAITLPKNHKKTKRRAWMHAFYWQNLTLFDNLCAKKEDIFGEEGVLLTYENARSQGGEKVFPVFQF